MSAVQRFADRKGLGPTELAKLLGVDRTTLWRNLTGVTEPSTKFIEGCIMAGIDPKELFGLKKGKGKNDGGEGSEAYRGDQ